MKTYNLAFYLCRKKLSLVNTQIKIEIEMMSHKRTCYFLDIIITLIGILSFTLLFVPLNRDLLFHGAKASMKFAI